MAISHSTSKTLPPNPSLESLKKQAKALLRAWRGDEIEARERVQAAHPRPEQFVSLRDAQLAIAREYGQPGWDDLRLAVEAANLAAGPRAELADAFVQDACLDYANDSPRRRLRAQRLLDGDTSLARENVYTAAAATDAEALREMVAADPGSASRPGGPRGWTPLMYLTYARLPRPAGDALEAACALLDAGADPNPSVRLSEIHHFTALTGAMGEGEAGIENAPPHPQARAIAELLLERGADPNDSQGLYNTHFTPGNEWIELLITHGLAAEARANWVEGDAPIGTFDFLLGVAVSGGYTDRVALLLDHGADPNGRDLYEHLPHWENALRYGRPEIAELLRSRGAEPVDLTPASRLRAHCMAEDRGAARTMLDADPSLIDDDRLVHDAVRLGSDEAVRLVFELGGSLEARGQHYSETPLHQAAIGGRDTVVDHLLELGARLDLRDSEFGGTPVGWANQGGHHALRERLLDQTEDVFDLAGWGRATQLRARLGAEPALARATLGDGETPLHCLWVGGESGAAVIDLLLGAGAHLDAADREGNTPLAAALAREDEEVAELLSERGAV